MKSQGISREYVFHDFVTLLKIQGVNCLEMSNAVTIEHAKRHRWREKLCLFDI